MAAFGPPVQEASACGHWEQVCDIPCILFRLNLSCQCLLDLYESVHLRCVAHLAPRARFFVWVGSRAARTRRSCGRR
eukprot:1768149-Pyramimonas_sp.AAC.1